MSNFDINVDRWTDEWTDIRKSGRLCCKVRRSGRQAVKCILVQNIYSGLKKIGNLWEKYREKNRKFIG